MPQISRHVRLDEALQLSGCPVCRIVLQRVMQSMESISYELVMDPAFRETVDSAWGFCNVHAQQWLEHAPPLGTAIVYEAVLRRLGAEDLQLQELHLDLPWMILTATKPAS